MNPEDVEVSRALQRLAPTSQPPLDRIRSRARTLRRRRRGASATVSVLAAAALATPMVGAIGDDGTESGRADTTSAASEPQEPDGSDRCRPQGDPDNRIATPLTTAEVPAEIRLLWSDSAAESPTSVRAEDPHGNFGELYPDCQPDDHPEFRSSSLYDVEDDVVTRDLQVVVWEDGPAAESRAPDQSSVIDVDGTEVLVFRPESTSTSTTAEHPERQVQVYWNGTDGELWRLKGTGGDAADVTDEEIRDLVGAAALGDDGGIDFGGSTVAQEATLVVAEDTSGSEYAPAGYASYEAIGPTLSLRVDELYGEGNVMFWAGVGDMYVADGVHGQPAVVLTHPDESTVRWEPVPGEVIASLTGRGYDADELLQIAQSIEPVAADDQRLADVWGVCPADEHSSSLLTPCED